MSVIPAGLMPHIKRFGWSGVVALGVVFVMLAGINPVTLISGKVSPPPPPTSITGVPTASATVEQVAAYPPVVGGEAELMWRRFFWQTAIRFPRVTLKVVENSSGFGCGLAGKDLTVMYCPQNRVVYADADAYQRLRTRFPLGADYAMAYLVAEAYGHHVQWALGIFTDLVTLQTQNDPDKVRAKELAIDQQGACYTGMWTITAGIDELNDNPAVMAAVDAVEANRGNAIINLPLGIVVPEVLSRASTEARSTWYGKGYAIPAPGSCKLDKIESEGLV
ncbi:neutral zinc metallopeptidase [Devosia sp. ZB163]|uniref:neutral zinc metallopeptidase n=1 Tax=Devosia sp. ZB163 TaxID=3025938 RepID=UPI00235E7805|nr:neutral zinc metallopeptidase [Devosia sp. ZB163]MDC9825754.1 neutral zinc metallopeptidase [Devosia sp. ZB163]